METATPRPVEQGKLKLDGTSAGKCCYLERRTELTLFNYFAENLVLFHYIPARITRVSIGIRKIPSVISVMFELKESVKKQQIIPTLP